MIRLLILDGNELGRIGLHQIFEEEHGILSVDLCSSMMDFEEATLKNDHNVVLMDYTSKGFSIVDVRTIRKFLPDAAIIAITPEQNYITVQHALQTGINGYVKKSCSIQEIKDAVHECSEGNPFFCGEIIKTLEDNGIPVERLKQGEDVCDPVIISQRELEIIQLIARGYSNPKIADKLFLSNHTVNAHKKNIFAKLGVNNTTGVVMYAVKNEIINPDEYLFSTDIN